MRRKAGVHGCGGNLTLRHGVHSGFPGCQCFSFLGKFIFPTLQYGLRNRGKRKRATRKRENCAGNAARADAEGRGEGIFLSFAFRATGCGERKRARERGSVFKGKHSACRRASSFLCPYKTAGTPALLCGEPFFGVERLFSKKERRRVSSLPGQAGRAESAFRFHGVASNSGKAGKAG